MIYDMIENYKNYSGYPELYTVLSYLHDFGRSRKDASEITLGDRIRGNFVRFTSKPAEECRYEAHKEYIDVHFILSGKERIATADVDSLTVDTPYDEKRDIGFYTGEQAGEYTLCAGDFMVCFPSDAHKVGMMAQSPGEVEKIVFKIRTPAVSRGICTLPKHMDVAAMIRGQLIVSCQALPHEPLHSSYIMGRMAQAAKEGGAGAIRANMPEDIIEIRDRTGLPVIGIIKRDYEGSSVYITPTMREVEELMKAGPEIIALDATLDDKPDGCTLDTFVQEIKQRYPGQLLMADCSTVEEAAHADRIGFDFIGTTLVGYTKQSKGMKIEADDFAIIRSILRQVSHPVIAEGNINTPEKARRVLELGCHSVVVGSIITRPQLITKSFAQEIAKR